mmetsp:Transcript_19977/g.59521  ORF Transcript_19977/g.59521 Transcript_19977/m.59521 type:complete len:308 (-) Transcript_19977:526-1449(-)
MSTMVCRKRIISEESDMCRSSAIFFSLRYAAELPSFKQVECLFAVVLRGNNITSFHALRMCPNIRFIDVSFNCISCVPSETFFKGIQGPADLKVLLCDHNHISNWESPRGLGAAHSLTVLTLEENPIACCTNYRRIVVNVIPHLKLLDHHPVAEEEHIEGANFTFTRYAAPSLCELGERVNTRWGCQKSLGLKFAVLGQAANALVENRLLEFTKLISRLACSLKDLLSPCTTIQRALRASIMWQSGTNVGTFHSSPWSDSCAFEREKAARCIQAIIRHYWVHFTAMVNLWSLCEKNDTEPYGSSVWR